MADGPADLKIVVFGSPFVVVILFAAAVVMVPLTTIAVARIRVTSEVRGSNLLVVTTVIYLAGTFSLVRGCLWYGDNLAPEQLRVQLPVDLIQDASCWFEPTTDTAQPRLVYAGRIPVEAALAATDGRLRGTDLLSTHVTFNVPTEPTRSRLLRHSTIEMDWDSPGPNLDVEVEATFVRSATEEDVAGFDCRVTALFGIET